jgi:hypothetical protein
MKTKMFFLGCLLFISTLTLFGENKNDSPSKKIVFKSKVNELYSNNKLLGFTTYKGGDLSMSRNTEFPIFVELIEGGLYHFIAVGDPDSKKMEFKLGLEGYGEIVTDKFKPQNTEEFWTEFSFICPKSGRYLLTFFQRGNTRNLMAHIGIMQQTRKTKEGILSFKH